LLILDEPAAGLDPRARVEIRELLVELAGMGKTVFFSTHILSDVSEICTRVGIIEAGSLVADGALENLKQQTMSYRSIHITTLGETDRTRDILEQHPLVKKVTFEKSNNDMKNKLSIEFAGDDLAISELLNSLILANIPVVHFSEDQDSIEQVFLRSTKGLVT